MYFIHLTEVEQHDLFLRTHRTTVVSRTRERLEMIRLSDQGWNIPKIAVHLAQHEQTVRFWVKAFLDGGFDALADQPHPGQKSAVTAPMLIEVRGWLAQGDQTWNARQVAAEVHLRFGLLRSPDQWRRLLRREHLSYKRTQRSLHHKQDPVVVAAKTAQLDTLKGGRQAGNSTCAISTKPDLR